MQWGADGSVRDSVSPGVNSGRGRDVGANLPWRKFEQNAASSGKRNRCEIIGLGSRQPRHAVRTKELQSDIATTERGRSREQAATAVPVHDALRAWRAVAGKFNAPAVHTGGQVSARSAPITASRNLMASNFCTPVAS